MAGRAAVSVVMSVHNGARYLAEALDSALQQKGVVVELVVVDDGSTDATPKVLAGYADRAVVLSQAQAGIGPARNRGMEHATAPALTFLDADDRLPPRSISRRVDALGADDGLAGVGGQARQFFSPDLPAAERAEIRLDPVVPAANVGGLVVRRAAFDRVGPFSDHTVGQGMEWMIRAWEAGLAFAMLPDVVLERRVHAANQGRTTSQRERFTILKASLDRRRSPHPDPSASSSS